MGLSLIQSSQLTVLETMRERMTAVGIAVTSITNYQSTRRKRLRQLTYSAFKMHYV